MVECYFYANFVNFRDPRYKRGPYGLSPWFTAVRIAVKVTLVKAYACKPSRKLAVSTPNLGKFCVFFCSIPRAKKASSGPGKRKRPDKCLCISNTKYFFLTMSVIFLRFYC